MFFLLIIQWLLLCIEHQVPNITPALWLILSPISEWENAITLYENDGLFQCGIFTINVALWVMLSLHSSLLLWKFRETGTKQHKLGRASYRFPNKQDFYKSNFKGLSSIKRKHRKKPPEMAIVADCIFLMTSYHCFLFLF